MAGAVAAVPLLLLLCLLSPASGRTHSVLRRRVQQRAASVDTDAHRYHVAIAVANAADRSLNTVCGGVLISPGVVVSAARCFIDTANASSIPFASLRVILGIGDYVEREEEGSSAVLHVRKIVIHKKYNVSATVPGPDNDIALVYLNECQRDIPLPLLNNRDDLGLPGSQVTAFGWATKRADCDDSVAVPAHSFKAVDLRISDGARMSTCALAPDTPAPTPAPTPASTPSPTAALPQPTPAQPAADEGILCLEKPADSASSARLCVAAPSSGTTMPDLGSPLLAPDQLGRLIVVGLVSRLVQQQQPAALPDMVATRMRAHQKWIKQMLAFDDCLARDADLNAVLATGSKSPFVATTSIPSMPLTEIRPAAVRVLSWPPAADAAPASAMVLQPVAPPPSPQDARPVCGLKTCPHAGGVCCASGGHCCEAGMRCLEQHGLPTMCLPLTNAPLPGIPQRTTVPGTQLIVSHGPALLNGHPSYVVTPAYAYADPAKELPSVPRDDTAQMTQEQLRATIANVEEELRKLRELAASDPQSALAQEAARAQATLALQLEQKQQQPTPSQAPPPL